MKLTSKPFEHALRHVEKVYFSCLQVYTYLQFML